MAALQVSQDDLDSISGVQERPNIKHLKLLIESTHISELSILLYAVQQTRRLLSNKRDPPIDDVISIGIIPILVDCLIQNDEPQLQFESLWALTNIASGTSMQTHAVVKAGAVPHFVHLLHSPHQEVREEAVWALGNIIADGPELRDLVIELGAVQPLVRLACEEVQISFTRKVAWVIANLCRQEYPPLPKDTICQLLPALVALIQNSDVNVVCDSVWAVLYLAAAGKDTVQMVIETGLLKFLIRLLKHPESKVQIASLSALSNILAETDEEVQTLLIKYILNYFPALLQHQSEDVNTEALRFLLNITNASQTQFLIQALIDADILPLIVMLLESDDVLTQICAAFIIKNIALKGNDGQYASLICCGVLPPLCQLLAERDMQLVTLALESLSIILKRAQNPAQNIVDSTHPVIDNLQAIVAQKIVVSGGYHLLVILQKHEIEEINKLACDIVNLLPLKRGALPNYNTHTMFSTYS